LGGLFVGCGGGSGSGGGTCFGGGNGTCNNGDDEGDTTLTKKLDFYTLEKDISLNGGVFFLNSNYTNAYNTHIIEEIEDNTNHIMKSIIYRQVPSSVASSLFNTLPATEYKQVRCDDVYSDPESEFCMVRIKTIALPNHIVQARVMLNQASPISCPDNNCEITLGLIADPTYFSTDVSNAITTELFKEVFTDNGTNAARANILRNIENNANGTSIQITRWLSSSGYDGSTLLRYIDYLKEAHTILNDVGGGKEGVEGVVNGYVYDFKNNEDSTRGIWVVDGSQLIIGW
jgi:hypothetical protein